MSKKSTHGYKRQTANFVPNQVPQFISIVVSEISKKKNYPPKDKCKLVAYNQFFDYRRSNLYSTGIFVKDGQNRSDVEAFTHDLLEEASNIVNAVLDKNPQNMNEAKYMLSELIK